LRDGNIANTCNLTSFSRLSSLSYRLSHSKHEDNSTLLPLYLLVCFGVFSKLNASLAFELAAVVN